MAKAQFPDEPIDGRVKPQGMTVAKATQLHRLVILSNYWDATEMRIEDGAWVILARRRDGHIGEFRDKETGLRYHRVTTVVDEFRSYDEFARRYRALALRDDEERRERVAADAAAAALSAREEG